MTPSLSASSGPKKSCVVQLLVYLALTFLCASGIAQVYNPANGHTYVRINQPMTFQVARAQATALGGYLVAINNSAETAFIVQNFPWQSNRLDWIGLTDEVTEGTFLWDSGEPLAYTNWMGLQPDNLNNEDHVEINLNPLSVNFGKWNDQHGTALRNTIVELPSGIPTAPLVASMYPATQIVSPGGTYAVQIFAPVGAQVALMIDLVPWSLPVPPYGTLGVGFPPLLAFDGIGLGFPGSISMPLTIGASGVLYFTYGPIPPFPGLTFYAQAVALHSSLPLLPPLGGIALSTHGSAALPTPACRATVDPGVPITLDAFAPADSNYQDAALSSSPDIDHSVPTPTFVQQTSAPTGYSAPVAWARVAITGLASQQVKLEYSIVSAATGVMVAFSTGAPHPIPAGPAGILSHTEFSEGTVQGLPNLAALPLGTYSITARLLVDVGGGSYAPTASTKTSTFTITGATPVILVHGLCGGTGTFGDLETLLENGSTPLAVRRFLYKCIDGPATGIGGKVTEFASFVQQTGYQSYDIVAHSMGGMISRRYFELNPVPSMPRPRLVMLGTPNFGAAFAYSGAAVQVLDTFCAGNMSTSQVRENLKAGSPFAQLLAADWPSVAAQLDILNVIGSCDGGDEGDAVVRAAEAYLPPVGAGPGGIINVYVPERHADWLYFVGCGSSYPEIAKFETATAFSRPGFIMLRDFLTASNPLQIGIPAGASLASPPSFTQGSMWIVPDPGWSGITPSTSQGTIDVNSANATWIWSGVDTGGTGQLLDPGGIGVLTCPLAIGLPSAGRTDWYVPIIQNCPPFGTTWSLVPDLFTPYP